MEFWEKPQKRKDDLLLKQLRKIRNQRGKRVTDTKPLLDAIIAEICGLSNVRYNWSETQCARFFERAIYHYLHGHEYLDQLLAASGFGSKYENKMSAAARRRIFSEDHPEDAGSKDDSTLRAREDNLLEELADSMRAEVQNGSITALLFKVFTETELRELGLEDLANQAAQHERTFYADGASLKTEKKICNLSSIPARFSGRELQLKQIADNFRNGAHIQVISGCAGRGKSIMAAEYVKLHSEEYQIICWINCSDRLTITGGVLNFFDHVGIKLPDYSPERVRNTFLQFFEENSNWLIIFDNPALTIAKQQGILEGFLPKNHTGHILIPARACLEPWGATLVCLDVMTETESVEFLTEAIGEKQQKYGVSDLAKCLGLEPVVLEYAATCIRETKWVTPSIYLHLLEERDFFGVVGQNEGDERKYKATFDILITRLRTHDKFQVDIVDAALLEFLMISPYICSGGTIDIVFLSQIFPVLPNILTRVCRDDGLRKQFLQKLRGYAFIEVQDGVLFYNDRARQVAYEYFSDQQVSTLTQIAEAMEAALVATDKNPYTDQERVYIQAAHYVRTVVVGLITSKPASFEELQTQYPHLVALDNHYYHQ